MGLLRVTGKLDISQFWPSGKSDADTTKVLIDVGQDAFQFQADPAAPFLPTHVFDHAKVKGRSTKPVITTTNKVTIRLQGIDAPELHYALYGGLPRHPAPTDAQRAAFKPLNVELRQPVAESSTYILGQMLATGGDTLDCTVQTQVDTPNDVFDTYGRMVGDLLVTLGGEEINVNRWLLQNGWVFPAFYTSMSNDEITTLTADAALGREKKTLLWKNFKRGIGTLDKTLRYRSRSQVTNFTVGDDAGKVIFPKIYRRLRVWDMFKEIGLTNDNFRAYIASLKDGCYLTSEFLQQGPTASTPYRLEDFIKSNRFTQQPEDLVFQEAPSTLYDEDNHVIEQW